VCVLLQEAQYCAGAPEQSPAGIILVQGYSFISNSILP
jgi:hypothetical protein